jgi:hypothetical protein
MSSILLLYALSPLVPRPYSMVSSSSSSSSSPALPAAPSPVASPPPTLTRVDAHLLRLLLFALVTSSLSPSPPRSGPLKDHDSWTAAPTRSSIPAFIDSATSVFRCRYMRSVMQHLPHLTCAHSSSARPSTFSGAVPFCPTFDAFALSTAAVAQHFPLSIPQGADGVLSLVQKWSEASAVGVGEQLLSNPRVRRSREVAFNASHTQWQPSAALDSCCTPSETACGGR